NGVAVHLDGARLWQCGPFYRRPLRDVAALFDTVYVSLYKDLGGLGGCILAGPEDVISEARVWRVRHGGRLASFEAIALSVDRGLVLPDTARQCPACGARDRRLDARDSGRRDRRALCRAEHPGEPSSQSARLFHGRSNETGRTPSSHQTPLTQRSRPRLEVH